MSKDNFYKDADDSNISWPTITVILAAILFFGAMIWRRFEKAQPESLPLPKVEQIDSKLPQLNPPPVPQRQKHKTPEEEKGELDQDAQYVGTKWREITAPQERKRFLG